MTQLIGPLTRPLTRRGLAWARAWSESSQQQACRNAMVASTALAERRHERLEVEGYLARTLQARAAATVPGQATPTRRLG